MIMSQTNLRFIVFLTLASTLLAASVEPQTSSSRSSFSLAVSRAHESHERSYLSAWAAAHRKWGNGVPVEAAESLSLANGEGQVSALPVKNDQIYVAQVEIGTPPQKVKLAMDTGSSDVWVQSTDTAYRINRDGPWPERYCPNASTTARQVEKAFWEISYADSSNALGIVYRDTLRMGGFEVKGALIESAAIISPSFENQTAFSGLMGLAKKVQTTIEPAQLTFLSLLKRQLKQPVFTVDLRANGTSRFDFGHIDKKLASEEITWLDSKPENPHWSIDLDLVAMPGRNHSVWLHHKFEAIVDTGSSLMFLPDLLENRYWSQVPQAHHDEAVRDSWRFPCVEAKHLLDILLKLPGTEHVVQIPGRYLNYGPLEQDPALCWGGMQSAAQFDGKVILGDVMLKALFVAFDMEKGRVGFASKILHNVK